MAFNTETFAEFFSIARPAMRPAPKYEVTFPCGATWQIDRHDWSFPVFADREQTGVECMPETLAEARLDAAIYGATIIRCRKGN
jgi:hypothetical protein